MPAQRGPAVEAGHTGTALLEANLRDTAIEVVSLEEDGVLLEITAAYHGVRRQAEALLREIRDGYVGRAETLDDLHRHATGSFSYYDDHERGPEGLTRLSAFYEKVARSADTPDVRNRALSLWLRFLEKVATESRGGPSRNLPLLLGALHEVEALLAEEPVRRALVTRELKRLVAALSRLGSEAEPALERAAKTLAAALLRLFHDRLGWEDPASWWREDHPHGATASTTDRPPSIDCITHQALRAYLARSGELATLEELRPRVTELLALPDDAQLQREYLEVSSWLRDQEGTLSEARWLTRILGSDGLTSLHEPALRRMASLCGQAVRRQDAAGRHAFVRGTMGLVRRMGTRHLASSLELVRRVGLQVLELGERETTDLFVEEALSLGFHHPRFEGYTDAWSIRVNAAHKENVRAYLDLIGANPVAARPLLAALAVWLKVGGVCLSDMDLLHRDVSRFLAKDLGPLYHHGKQLLRLLPVYFTDIGAEGDLRRVSTRLDEIRCRSDALCHFLRKQSHVESSPLLIHVVERAVEYWATGDPAGLRPYLPPSVYATLRPGCRDEPGLHDIFRALLEHVGDLEALLDLDTEEVTRRIAGLPGGDAGDREKAGLVFALHRELERKYRLDHQDLLERLAAHPRVSAATLIRLEETLAKGAHREAIDELLGVLETLQGIILSVGPHEAVEDIYHKRHIAVGVPSMYGSYREERLEALGLTYRIESLAEALLARRIRAFELTDRLLEELPEVSACLRQLERALRLDGFVTAPIGSALAMLDEALAYGIRSTGQFLDIFHLLSRGVEEVVQTYFVDFYGGLLDRLFDRMAKDGVLSSAQAVRAGPAIQSPEAFLRSQIEESFGLQLLDDLCSGVIRALNTHGIGVPAAGTGAVGHHDDLASWTVPLAPGREPDTIRLGNKGANLQRLVHHGFPVPPGFIIGTELFARSRTTGLECPFDRAFVEKIRSDLTRLEEGTGASLGDPNRPLLLSVRGGAPISMPGMLDSFLNVGINSSLAEHIAERRGHAWAAWDAYRRFVQLWGMSHGIERDPFDRLIQRAKAAVGVAKKVRLPAERMRLLALEYRTLVEGYGIHVVDDPFEQLLRCIWLVLRSWDAAKARLYRREVHIAEEWGTAVVVQSMVFGNLHGRSGTGVARTRASLHEPGEIRLSGDFIVQGQGDDVVSGLVETLPLSEMQRREQAKRSDRSLEKDFPIVYEALLGHAGRLIRELGLPPQEIEFTFEDDEAEALYLLQTRDVVLSRSTPVPTFAPGTHLDRAHVATGIGASGGALSGRVARTQQEIDAIHGRYPGERVILIRPDTVPEDIHLVLQADGLLTSVGGATSHAAVVAKRLSKTCVVGCTELDAYDDRSEPTLAGRPLLAGDLVSINGADGFVYLGSLPVSLARGCARTNTSKACRPTGGRRS